MFPFRFGQREKKRNKAPTEIKDVARGTSREYEMLLPVGS